MFRSQCTICTDLLSAETLVACPCGHVYHDYCLGKWLQQRATCPTCRKACHSGIRLYFSEVQEVSSSDDILAVKNELARQTALKQEKEQELQTVKKKLSELNNSIEEQLCLVQQCQMATENEKAQNKSLQQQIEFLTEKTQHVSVLEKKVINLKTNLERLQRFETILNGTHEEAEEMLKNIGTGSKTAGELASQLIIMKRENEKMRSVKKKTSVEKAQLEKDYNSISHKLKTKQVECSKLNQEIETLKENLDETEQEKTNLKKKLDKMQLSLETASPRGTLINRLLQESPAPARLSPAPPINLNETVVLFSDTDENVEHVEEERQSLSKKPKPDFISPVHPGALKKNRKRSYINIQNPGRLSTGYNGLGGHSTVLMPSQKKIKKVSKPPTISKFVRTANPPLPRM